jgi:D-hydroxyproline dehydrogenase subunit gamma
MHIADQHRPSIRAETPARWSRDARVARGRPVRITVGGVSTDAFEGESLVVALAMAGHLVLRHSPTAGTPRGAFCLMGVCQECVVHVDGAAVTACLEPVRPGMTVVLDRSSGAAGGSEQT